MSTLQAPMPTTDQAAAAAAAVSAPAAAVAIGKPKISTCKDLKTASISNKPKFTYKDANDKELACVHVSFSPPVPLPEGAKILSYSIKLKCTSGQNKVLQTKTLTAHPAGETVHVLKLDGLEVAEKYSLQVCCANEMGEPKGSDSPALTFDSSPSSPEQKLKRTVARLTRELEAAMGTYTQDVLKAEERKEAEKRAVAERVAGANQSVTTEVVEAQKSKFIQVTEEVAGRVESLTQLREVQSGLRKLDEYINGDNGPMKTMEQKKMEIKNDVQNIVTKTLPDEIKKSANLIESSYNRAEVGYTQAENDQVDFCSQLGQKKQKIEGYKTLLGLIKDAGDAIGNEISSNQQSILTHCGDGKDAELLAKALNEATLNSAGGEEMSKAYKELYKELPKVTVYWLGTTVDPAKPLAREASAMLS